MTHSQSKWYSSGYDLWVVPFKSPWYSQIDWWSQFFLSNNVDETQFKKGQTYVVDVRRFLPNKKVWIYPPETEIKDVLTSAENLAKQLGLRSVRVFTFEDCQTPDEARTGLKWSIVTSPQPVVN